jgi:caffeoyl-CoA O-methyltransferase
MRRTRSAAVLILGCGIIFRGLAAQDAGKMNILDKKVAAFLEDKKADWHDMNIPESDGRALYDLIVRKGYRDALEIGTSTGHSGIWIAWALSKTGGKLVTIEIDEERHKQAVENFREAGLLQFIDARLGDAHEMVPALEGPFDFVFADADKEWSKKYFTDVFPRLAAGGSFTTHNTAHPYGGIKEFLDYVKGLPNVETTFIRSSRAGISVSVKKSE